VHAPAVGDGDVPRRERDVITDLIGDVLHVPPSHEVDDAANTRTQRGKSASWCMKNLERPADPSRRLLVERARALR
jgi:hypothetical protein